jgi:ATP-binding cassette, subfamily B, bacterial PglK
MHALATIFGILTRSQRRHFFVLQAVALLMAVSTVLSLAAVMAYIAVLADPAQVDAHAPLRWARQFFGTQREFLLALGGVFIATLVASALVNVFGSRAMSRFAYAVGDRVRVLLFGGYLRRDYLFHLRTGAARVMDDVLYQADRVIVTLLHGQMFITNALLTLLVVVSIAVVSPVVAGVGVLALGGSYLLLFRIVRRRIAHNGQIQTRLGAERMAVVEQAFLGIKYLLVAGAQDSFSRRFEAVIRQFSRTSADTQLMGQFPRYLLECVAGVALIASAAAVSGSPGSAWLAQLGFIGFAGFRLLPAFQQMYYAVVLIRAQRPAVEALANQLEICRLEPPVPEPGAVTPLDLRTLELAGVSFRYAPAMPLVLEDVSLRIPAGAAVGIVGASGCGKTTLVDVIIGLLAPTAGRVDVNGAALQTRGLARWHRSVGYVPQDLLILDAPVRENIAFGLAPGAIDDRRVREVAALAGASGFIELLPGGYDAPLGGGSGALSGGQRQRIGIARALYHDPALLVLDEATNALDADTERAIVDAVIRNRGARTVIVITHGAAAIEACDCAYELRNGRLYAAGAARMERTLRAREAAAT